MTNPDEIQLLGQAVERYMTDALFHARVQMVTQLLRTGMWEVRGESSSPAERQLMTNVAAVTLLMFPPAGDQMPVGVALDSAEPGEELRVLMADVDMGRFNLSGSSQEPSPSRRRHVPPRAQRVVQVALSGLAFDLKKAVVASASGRVRRYNPDTDHRDLVIGQLIEGDFDYLHAGHITDAVLEEN